HVSRLSGRAGRIFRMTLLQSSEQECLMNRPSNRSQLWESGAEDTRTPDASRPPGVSEPREASGVRPIYRRFSSGAGRPAVHGPHACETANIEPPTSNLQAAPGWDTAPYREMIHGRYPREKSVRG